jgi:hypothetical protein
VRFQDWEYEDGDPPPAKVIASWNDLTLEVFTKAVGKPCIAVHCVAGLGRCVSPPSFVLPPFSKAREGFRILLRSFSSCDYQPRQAVWGLQRWWLCVLLSQLLSSYPMLQGPCDGLHFTDREWHVRRRRDPVHPCPPPRSHQHAVRLDGCIRASVCVCVCVCVCVYVCMWSKGFF